jgi:hypothetical protein
MSRWYNHPGALGPRKKLTKLERRRARSFYTAWAKRFIRFTVGVRVDYKTIFRKFTIVEENE